MIFGLTLRDKVISSLGICMTVTKRYFSYNGSLLNENNRIKMTFRLIDYDCIGFDLDNTLCQYKLDSLFSLIYTETMKLLVNKKGYDKQLLKPFDSGQDFLHKGLILDADRGNFLKIGSSGNILRASHGTRPLNQSEIITTYGTRRLWQPVVDFKNAFFNDDNLNQLWFFKDYFDMPFALVCARVVDVLDACDVSGADQGKANQPCDNESLYKFKEDVLEAANEFYGKEDYSGDSGSFDDILKASIDKYVKQSSIEVKNWLCELKRSKKLFLLTSASNHFASFLLEYCLGSDWRDYFDIVITSARKPGFFTGNRKFLDVRCDNEPIETETPLQCGKLYSQGNYSQLRDFFSLITGKRDPKVLYFGDHLVHDIFVPSKFSRCHTVAVVEEMEAEGMKDCLGDCHPAAACLTSSVWGSFFYDDALGTGDSSVSGVERINTLLGHVILTHSQIAVAKLDTLAVLPVDTQLSSFKLTSGFYPADPIVLHN